MNSYIQLVHPTNGAKKYATKLAWEPSVIKPSTVRAAPASGIDVTYGPTKFRVWEGEIKARVTPASGYGTPTELEATLNQMGAITFTDHMSNTVSVHVQEWRRQSFSPMWDGSSNFISYYVKLQGV